MPVLMRSISQAFLADLHKPARQKPSHSHYDLLLSSCSFGGSPLDQSWDRRDGPTIKVRTSPWRKGSSPSERPRRSGEPHSAEPFPHKSFQPALIRGRKLCSQCRNMPKPAKQGAAAIAIPLPRRLPLSHSLFPAMSSQPKTKRDGVTAATKIQ